MVFDDRMNRAKTGSFGKPASNQPNLGPVIICGRVFVPQIVTPLERIS
jgi:hypothetical protein